MTAPSALTTITACRPGIKERALRGARGYENPTGEIIAVEQARRLAALGATLTLVNAIKSPFDTETGTLNTVYQFAKKRNITAAKEVFEQNKLVQGARTTRRIFDGKLRPAVARLQALHPAPQKFEPLNSKL